MTIPYYDQDTIEDVAEKAACLLHARNQYIKAWVDWSDTCLSGYGGVDEEIDIMKYVLEFALEGEE